MLTHRQITVLSPSTVALGVSAGTPEIDIWDWKEGKCVRTLTGFAGRGVFGLCLLSDGRLLVSDEAGTVRIGSTDDWSNASVMMTSSAGFCSVLAGHDGSFVTISVKGSIQLWRNGVCEITLDGAGQCTPDIGATVSEVGGRLVVVGRGTNLLVAEEQASATEPSPRSASPATM